MNLIEQAEGVADMLGRIDCTHKDAVLGKRAITDLLAIVKRLPVTADGVVALPAMELWHPLCRSSVNDKRLVPVYVEPDCDGSGGVMWFAASLLFEFYGTMFKIDECYLTKEAANDAG